MKKIFALLLITVIIGGCANDKKEKSVIEKTATTIDSTLITDSSWGAINKTTDFAGLQKIFGSSNVKDETICGPECADSVDVTIIYPEAKNEMIVYWKDSLYHRAIDNIKSQMPDAPYHTASGLKIGSSMQELLKVNGQKITFSGFGWDYGGYIQSFNNGALEKSPVYFRLDLPEIDDSTLWAIQN